MNFIKRAYRSILFHKKNTFLLFGIFLILSTLILSGLCIRYACEQTAEQIRRGIGAEILMTNSKLSSSEVRGQNAIPLEKVMMIDDFSEINGGNYHVLSAAFPVSFLAVISEEQQKVYSNDATLMVYGDTRTASNQKFAQGMISLASDQSDNVLSANEAIISKTLAGKNNLDIGDTITIKSAYSNQKEILRIVGLYISNQSIIGDLLPIENPENMVFTTAEISMKLNGEDNINRATFHVTDPLLINSVIERAQALPKIGEWDKGIQFIKNDSEYRSMADALNGLTGITLIMLISAIVMGASILTLLTVIAMKERDFEIGILLAMGERKWKIIIQLNFEVLVPVIIAVTLAVFMTMIMTQQIGNILDIENIIVQVETQPVLMLYMCCIGLVMFASVFTIYKIIFYKPQKILIAIE